MPIEIVVHLKGSIFQLSINPKLLHRCFFKGWDSFRVHLKFICIESHISINKECAGIITNKSCNFFNLQVVPLRLVYDIQLGLWLLGTFNCNCSCGSSSVLWTSGSMTYSKRERHSCEYLLSQGYSEYPLASLIVYLIVYIYLVQTTQPKLEVSSSPEHTLWKLEKTNFRMDAPGFEPLTLSIELAIDWHANPLSHHGSVQWQKTFLS